MRPEGSPLRRRYIDWARGIAVLLMLGWHTADAWTRLDARRSAAFGWVLVLGGFAAPLFLWLAGLGLAMSAARKAEAGESRESVAATICCRGLELFILAFAFRLQAFIISGNHPVSIFRVDILNVMGLAVALAGLLWLPGRTTHGRIVWYSVIAAGIAMLTPIARTTAYVDVLPMWAQWYLRPTGDLTTFTLLPWSGFVLAGAACGVVLGAVRSRQIERQAHLTFAVVGVALVMAGLFFASRPSIYANAQFWTSSPTWFAIRVGIVMLAVAIVHSLADVAANANVVCRPLERLGQSSLFVYWLHVELAYGYVAWPLRRRLPLWGTAVAFVGFTVLMYAAVVVRDRGLDAFRAARRRSAPQTAPA